MTREELLAIDIKHWDDIRKNYDHPDLFLGNGFSISLSEKFRYDSLFETFIKKIDNNYEELFRSFNITNFEQILSFLKRTEEINTILEIDTEKVKEAIRLLKKGLIETINEIHPKVNEIDEDRLHNITRELIHYNDIYTTNYDLYLYNMIMITKDIHRGCRSFNRYQDYFWGGASGNHKQFMGYQDFPDYKHVYYLHGALFIFNVGIYDFKLTRNNRDKELIDLISHEITNGNIPLFITEGNYIDKLTSIYKSRYLSFCLNSFEKAVRPLLIFGNSFSDFDFHIFDILKSSSRNLIISIYTEGKTKIALQAEVLRIKEMFDNYKADIEFIDSSSVFPI